MLKGNLNIVSGMISIIILGLTGFLYYILQWQMALVVFLLGVILTLSPRIVLEWEKGVLLRLGKFSRVLDSGIVWVIPGIDVISAMVDMRIRTTSFSAEKTLTKDTVPVDVDAVLFWVVTDAKRSILEVELYERAINWAAQTTLRDIIGRSELVKMISDREALDQELLNTIDAKTTEWGITVQSVELRDVRIPSALEDSMSRKAQADREKEARIILSQSELEVARQMKMAASVYAEDDISLKLRTMNMTYESIREKGALMVIPSSMAESLSGQTMGIAAAGFRYGQQDSEMDGKT
ncbi:MAG: slipin family protein [Deltaproteobacteria bacterium]|jgi:regulator of protease activity HflC (stomatin/prohibitin superfamily)|nr:slipin family protein [Deltaproteobacteria bacterium]MBT4644724.1 slipin family protein [Deltaproteobacteria bacterium]MBT6504695.1 slipin family protein [Deltaproteobacteria bacterium]MBT6611583.1 slipin family protein [Deltaproteobacteria bacterium]MBT7153895.1 slipin family protein [Deltaproteobacteria bacterium]